jgi:hypothetical protein
MSMQSPGGPHRPAPTLPSREAPPSRAGRWWSSDLARPATFAVGAALLETLPISAVLQTAAAYIVGAPTAALLPLWYLTATALVALGIARGLRQRAPGATVLAALPVFLALAALALRVSPAAYGALPGDAWDLSWFGAFARDALAGSGRMSDVFGLVLLMGYVWWRGLRLGRQTPNGERLATSFTYGLAVVIVMVILTASLRGAGRAPLVGRLALLLPLEVFAGLVVLAVARAEALDQSPRGAGWVGTPRAAPWLTLALALAGGIVAAALLLSVLLSYDTISAALNSLGPVGAALSAGIQWLIYGFSYVLFTLLSGPLAYIRSLAGARQTPVRPPTPPNVGHTGCTGFFCPSPALSPAQGIVVAIVLAAVGVAVLSVVFYGIYRSLRALRQRASEADDWEDRQALDGRSLLAAQLRSVLAGLRRAPRRGAAALPEASVRRLYRDVLQAAAQVGLGRQPAETPDEFAERLTATDMASEHAVAAALGARGGDRDLAALTNAYDRVRYGEIHEDPADRAALQASARRLAAGFQARQRVRER